MGGCFKIPAHIVETDIYRMLQYQSVILPSHFELSNHSQRLMHMIHEDWMFFQMTKTCLDWRRIDSLSTHLICSRTIVNEATYIYCSARQFSIPKIHRLRIAFSSPSVVLCRGTKIRRLRSGYFAEYRTRSRYPACKV